MMEGFVFPADWEEHAAVWLAWPPDDWIVENGLNAREAHCRVISALLPHVRVELLVNNSEEEKDVIARVTAAGLAEHLSRLNCRIIPHTDIWMRDFGPIFVQNKNGNKQAILSFDWTMWGYLWHHRRQHDPSILAVCL